QPSHQRPPTTTQHTIRPTTLSVLLQTRRFIKFACTAIAIMEFGHKGVLNEDGIHVDMDRLKKGEVKYVLHVATMSAAGPRTDRLQLGNLDHGGDVQRRRHPRYATLLEISTAPRHEVLTSLTARRRLADDDGGLHCKPSDGQVDQSTRHHLVLQIGLGRRHASRGRHCAIPAGAVCDAQRQAPDDADGSVDIPGDLLRQQGPPVVSTPASRQPTPRTGMLTSLRDRAGLIIAGWDERFGGQVYSIPLGGSLHKQSYAIGGSGSTYIYGYCDANWKEGMEEADAVNFVKGALREAIKWDGSSGGVIRMVVLTKKGADRHLYLPDTDYKARHE
ncbi:Proteasome subunit beta type, partial [Tolypocladium paradoxum]